MTSTSIQTWALPRLQQILPLDEDSLKQVIDYANTLPKDAAAEHLKNLLGDDVKSLEFINNFNQRRKDAPSSSTSHAQPSSSTDSTGIPRQVRKPTKKKPNIHALPTRQIEDRGDTAGVYQKRDQDDYMPGASRPKARKEKLADNLALQQDRPEVSAKPRTTHSVNSTNPAVHSPVPPSAAGPLISDSLTSKRPASPAPKAKIAITGGTAMHGASTALTDLDSAIRSLELQTNPTLAAATSSADDIARRTCNCMATRHPLLAAAPNCTACGKIICVKQGLGPCTFCGSPLLSPDDLQKVLRVLKDERGEERMRTNNAGHHTRRPHDGATTAAGSTASAKPRAYTGRDFLAATRATPSLPDGTAIAASTTAAAADAAVAHRDKLLGFQAANARRTRVHDEAADFEVPASGTNMWASPAERAAELKRQQKVLREMEWNARPDYERRRVVASIDLVGGKVVRRMAEVEKPDFGKAESAGEDDGVGGDEVQGGSGKEGGGAFSRNPLASGLVRPVAREGGGKGGKREKSSMWRRVQMDEDDNEQWILDGGVYGDSQAAGKARGDEPESG